MGKINRLFPSLLFVLFFILVVAPLNTVEANALEIALVCRTANCTNTDRDVALKDHLNALGHTITMFDDDDTSWDPESFSGVVISASVDSWKVAWLKDKVVGILTLSGNNNNEFWLANAGHSNAADTTTVVIMDDTHPITQDFNDGVTDVASTTGNGGWMRSWQAGQAEPLAVYTHDTKKAKILVIDEGQTLVNGDQASERRAFIGAEFFAKLNSDGLTLFDRTLEWITYSIPSVTSNQEP